MSDMTKIDAAIKDMKLSLKKTEEDIKLLLVQKKVLENNLSMLETIKNNDKYC